MLVGATAVFYLVNLSLTILAQTLAPPFERVPPMVLVPENVLMDGARHAVAGALLGCLTLDPVSAVLTAMFSISVDVDHIFLLTGLNYLPRPAHSVIFPIALAGSLWLVYRRRDLVLASSTAFLGHIALDSGRFPLLSPIYFHYFVIPDWIDLVFMIAAVALNGAYAYSHWKTGRSKSENTREAKAGVSGSPRVG